MFAVCGSRGFIAVVSQSGVAGTKSIIFGYAGSGSAWPAASLDALLASPA